MKGKQQRAPACDITEVKGARHNFGRNFEIASKFVSDDVLYTHTLVSKPFDASNATCLRLFSAPARRLYFSHFLM